MIKIILKNGDVCTYKPDSYTEYKYDRKYFVIINKNQWIGLYNLDCIEYITIDG